MVRSFFVSDLHGRINKYEALFAEIEKCMPDAVFLGGDLLPHSHYAEADKYEDFLKDYLIVRLTELRDKAGLKYPAIFMIPGNDDPRINEEAFIEAENRGLWNYMHLRHKNWNGFDIAGCAYVPPTPFRLKDWERYDVSRYVDPGCVHPEDGKFSVPPPDDIGFTNIASLLDDLGRKAAMEKFVLLMHSPPYKSFLDRAALDGMMCDHVPLDPHVGSIALERFIKEKQPMLSLHGHIHESSDITGHWFQQFGRTLSVNAAWQGKELSLISFDLNNPENIDRMIINT